MGELGQQSDASGENLVEVGGLAEEDLDGLPLRPRERAQVGQVVDEQAVALVGGNPPRRGVRRDDEFFFFEQRHVVADGRGRHSEGVPVDDGLGPHGFPGGHVVLHDDAEDFEAAIRHHFFDRLPLPVCRRRLALSSFDCQSYRGCLAYPLLPVELAQYRGGTRIIIVRRRASS
jgi:hypothetical protein